MNFLKLVFLKAFKRFLGGCGGYFAARAYRAYGGPGGPSSSEHVRCSELARRFYDLQVGLSSYLAGDYNLAKSRQD